MSGTFPPAPTYAPPIEEDKVTGKTTFSPLWLQWFLDAAQYLSSLGNGGTNISHNGLNGLQGGATGDYFHLTGANAAAVTGARITKGVQTADYLVITDATKGLVLKDTQGTPHYWRITISNVGAIVITDLGTSIP